MSEVEYDLKELCEVAEVTPRTVHFYIQLGLLPRAGAPGPGSRYGAEHLARLRLIKLLQQEHLPLAEIRQRLEPLEFTEIQRLLKEHAPRRQASAASAADYIRSVLEGRGNQGRLPVPERCLQATPRQVQAVAKAAERSQWERISLCPDVELHIRRPLSRQQNRRLDRLLTFARELFEEDSCDS